MSCGRVNNNFAPSRTSRHSPFPCNVCRCTRRSPIPSRTPSTPPAPGGTWPFGTSTWSRPRSRPPCTPRPRCRPSSPTRTPPPSWRCSTSCTASPRRSCRRTSPDRRRPTTTSPPTPPRGPAAPRPPPRRGASSGFPLVGSCCIFATSLGSSGRRAVYGGSPRASLRPLQIRYEIRFHAPTMASPCCGGACCFGLL